MNEPDASGSYIKLLILWDDEGRREIATISLGAARQLSDEISGAIGYDKREVPGA
jgi:hypothetical protein